MVFCQPAQQFTVVKAAGFHKAKKNKKTAMQGQENQEMA